MRNAPALLLLACCAVCAAQPMEPSAPLFENDQVKVVRALEQPHRKGGFHEHKLDRVMVYLQNGRQRFEYQDGRPAQVFDWTRGQVKWSPAEGFHSPEVVSDLPFNIIEIILKKPGAGHAVIAKPDPLQIDPKHYSLEFENPQVRVLRVKIGPHETTPLHQHALNRVTIFLTPQNFRVSAPEGQIQSVQHKEGDIVWGTPVTHAEENLRDQPFEAVVVELKN